MKPLVKCLRDKDGSYWIIPEDIEKPEITCWWQRANEKKGRVEMSVEKLCIRQETSETRADVIELSFGQVYALIDALNRIVEDY